MTPDNEDSIFLELEDERQQREYEEEKKKRKERQRMFDDIGVMVTMLAITLLAVLVVIIKFLIVHTKVSYFRFLGSE